MSDKELEHKSGCGHDHSHDQELDRNELDAASKSLVDALRISFIILKLIMVVLVVMFIVSGIFRVEENEKALILRFGKFRGGQANLLGPGLEWAFPEPIDEIIKIPVTDVQTMEIDSFWYFETPQEKLGGRAFPQPTLDPVKDGYSLTRNDAALSGSMDFNIVHSKWKLNYRIGRPEKFFRNVYVRAPQPGETFFEAASETVEPLLKNIASNAIVTTMVRYSIDEAIVSEEKISSDVEEIVQDKLDAIECGIVVDSMQVSGRITWPRQVNEDFQASNKASNESQKLISEAKAYAKTILSEAEGASAQIIADAQADRMTVVETAKANAEYLEQLLPEYRKRPKLVLQKIYQDAIEEVLNNADEKIFIQPDISGQSREVRVQINRDPSIKKNKVETNK